MFPYSTDRQLQRTPWATIALIAVCCVVEGICLARFDVRLALAPAMPRRPGALSDDLHLQ